MSQIKSVAFDDGSAPIPSPEDQMKAAKAQGDVNILPTEVAAKPTSDDDDVNKKAADVTEKLASQVEGKPEVVLKHKVGDSQSDTPVEVNTTPKNVVVL